MMRKAGIVALVIGAIIGVIGLSMKTTVETGFGPVVNLGLMDDRRNALIVAALVIVVGIILFVAGTLQKSAVTAASKASRSSTSSRLRSGMKQCPYCAENIKAEAKVCRYCGRDLPESSLAASRPRRLRKVPARMSKAYATWQQTMRETDFREFIEATSESVSLLPGDVTAADLEATFPGIPVDFDAILDE